MRTKERMSAFTTPIHHHTGSHSWHFWLWRWKTTMIQRMWGPLDWCLPLAAEWQRAMACCWSSPRAQSSVERGRLWISLPTAFSPFSVVSSSCLLLCGRSKSRSSSDGIAFINFDKQWEWYSKCAEHESFGSSWNIMKTCAIISESIYQSCEVHQEQGLNSSSTIFLVWPQASYVAILSQPFLIRWNAIYGIIFETLKQVRVDNKCVIPCV